MLFGLVPQQFNGDIQFNDCCVHLNGNKLVLIVKRKHAMQNAECDGKVRQRRL